VTCPAIANIAGNIVSCDGKHKPGSPWHNLDYASLPHGFIIGDVGRNLMEQGVTKIKFYKRLP
jgi:hypothetical protein